MGLSEQEMRLISDHESAQTYGNQYLGEMNNALFARGQILNLAMEGFNEFLKLPKTDSKYAAIWDFAFNALAMAVPALRLTQFIDRQHIAANAAYEIAKAVGDRATKAKAVKVITTGLKQGGKVANKINDIKGKVGGITESGGKVMEEDKGQEAKSDLSKRLDASRKVVRDLIKDGDKALESWKKALSAELQTFQNRLSGAEKTPGESLRKYIERLLEAIPKLTDEELDQVETKFLWLMLVAYCRSNVQIVETTHITQVHTIGGSRDYPEGTTLSITGLNNTQQNTLVEWFGKSVKRGKHFSEPVISDAYDFLRLAKSTVTQKTNYNSVFSESMK